MDQPGTVEETVPVIVQKHEAKLYMVHADLPTAKHGKTSKSGDTSVLSCGSAAKIRRMVTAAEPHRRPNRREIRVFQLTFARRRCWSEQVAILN